MLAGKRLGGMDEMVFDQYRSDKRADRPASAAAAPW
jgi:hypothetical protein